MQLTKKMMTMNHNNNADKKIKMKNLVKDHIKMKAKSKMANKTNQIFNDNMIEKYRFLDIFINHIQI